MHRTTAFKDGEPRPFEVEDDETFPSEGAHSPLVRWTAGSIVPPFVASNQRVVDMLECLANGTINEIPSIEVSEAVAVQIWRLLFSKVSRERSERLANVGHRGLYIICGGGWLRHSTRSFSNSLVCPSPSPEHAICCHATLHCASRPHPPSHPTDAHALRRLQARSRDLCGASPQSWALRCSTGQDAYDDVRLGGIGGRVADRDRFSRVDAACRLPRRRRV